MSRTNPERFTKPRIMNAPIERYRSWRYGLFIHYSLATYHDREWATGHEDPATFRPTHLDCAQWAAAAKEAGMGYGVLTAKHTDGFALWPTKTSATHTSTALRNFRDGRGDLVREFLDAFRAAGLGAGLYYCLPGNFSGQHLPSGATDLHGLAPEAGDDMVGFIRAQLQELLTGYGPIDVLWIDQFDNPYTGAAWTALHDFIKSLQPGCVLVINNCQIAGQTDIFSYEYPWMITREPHRALPPEGNTIPAEVCDTLVHGWFWRSGNVPLKSAADTAALIRICRERNANYLLNVGPDRSGRIPDDVQSRLAEIRAMIS